MELELFSYSSNTLLTNAAFLKGNPIEFYSQDENRNYVEKTLFGEIVKQANKRNTKLYKIKDTTNSLTDNVCFFAISVGHIEANKKTNIPSVVIDYFIVNDKYRKQTLNNGLTIAQECFRSILSLIDQLSNQIGIRYIILQPLNKEAKIINFYDDFGFKFIQGRKSDWMYLDIAYIK